MRGIEREGGMDGSPSRPSWSAFPARPAVAPCRDCSSCAIKPKELLCGFGRCFSNFVACNASSLRDGFSYDARMRRFAALSTKRRGRQIWTIRFDHKFPERDFRRDLSYGYAVFESDNSRKRNEVVETENFTRLIERAAEAMKNTVHFARVRAQDFQRVRPRVALVNDDIESKLDCQIQLLLEQTRLFRFVRAVANLRFDFFIGLTSQSTHNLHLLFSGYSFTRQMMVVQAGFANGHDSRVLCPLAQRRNPIGLRLVNLTWMNPNRGVNRRIIFRDLDRTPAALD